jgi:hypothetical protein
MRAVRAALGERGFAAAWAQGRALPLDEAMSLALASRSEATQEDLGVVMGANERESGAG